jgi:hypothetical protein
VYKLSELERFLKYVTFKEDGCWDWTGYRFNGYGHFWWAKHTGPAHRFAFEVIGGTTIPDGLTIDHLCRNRRCVNPDHMEPVTRGENARRGDAGIVGRLKTHCPHGHEYTPENTLISHPLDSMKRSRICRTCSYAATYKAYHRRQEAKKRL